MAIFMDNEPRMLICEGGAERTGLYYTCVNSYLSVEEVAYIVNDSEAKVVVSSASKADVVSELPASVSRVSSGGWWSAVPAASFNHSRHGTM